MRNCVWWYVPEAALPDGVELASWNDLGVQSANALNDLLAEAPADWVLGIDIYRIPGGARFASVQQQDASTAIYQEGCSGGSAFPYVVGMALGAVGLGAVGAYAMKRFRPASTMIGAALGLVVGGGLGHAMARRYGGTMDVTGTRTGLVKAVKTKKIPMQVGSLYLPRGGGLPRSMQVGLVEASKRYQPKNKNW